MGYLSFDASVKIHQSGRYTSTKTSKTGYGGIRGYIRHIDRGTDRKNNCEVEHSNPDINPLYTLENESYYKNSQGVWQKTDKSSDMTGAVNRRVAYAKEHGARIASKGQNDTVIARPLVVQLDSETIKGHGDSWVWDSIEIIEQIFGKENIVGFSVHKDETNVHLHVIFVPCYETEKDSETKCTLSQSKFFRSPKQLASMHQKIRKFLCNRGYEVEQENKPIEEQLAGYYDKEGVWHQQGLTPDQLKELSQKELNLKMEEINMKLRRDEMDRLEQAMKEMQESAKAKQEQLDRDRKDLSSQMVALETDRANVQAQLQALVEEKVTVQKAKEEAEEMLEKAYSTADVYNRILSDEKNLNTRFMEFLDREEAETGKPARRYVEYLYKKFQKERRDSLSDWQLEMLNLREERTQNRVTGFVPDIISSGSSTGMSL